MQPAQPAQITLVDHRLHVRSDRRRGRRVRRHEPRRVRAAHWLVRDTRSIRPQDCRRPVSGVRDPGRDQRHRRGRSGGRPDTVGRTARGHTFGARRTRTYRTRPRTESAADQRVGSRRPCDRRWRGQRGRVHARVPTSRPARSLAYTLVFGVLAALWCVLAAMLARRRPITETVERMGHILMPIVFIVIGMALLATTFRS